jgi:hypothetical protein
MNNKNIISNNSDLNWSTMFSYKENAVVFELQTMQRIDCNIPIRWISSNHFKMTKLIWELSLENLDKFISSIWIIDYEKKC